MSGRRGIINHDHGPPDQTDPVMQRWGWAGLIVVIYLPGALTVVGFIVGGVLCRNGNVQIFDRLLGPLTAITFGWTSLGVATWEFSRGMVYVLQRDSRDGRSLIARWAEALLPAVFGAALMALGAWRLFWGGH